MFQFNLFKEIVLVILIFFKFESFLYRSWNTILICIFLHDIWNWVKTDFSQLFLNVSKSQLFFPIWILIVLMYFTWDSRDKGTSINDVLRFLAIFDLPTYLVLLYNVRFWGLSWTHLPTLIRDVIIGCFLDEMEGHLCIKGKGIHDIIPSAGSLLQLIPLLLK